MLCIVAIAVLTFFFMCCCTWLEQSGGDLTDINSSETSPQCGLAVTADDFGKVKLFNTPCIKWDAPYCKWKNAVFCVYRGCWSKRATVVVFSLSFVRRGYMQDVHRGHSSHITNCMWNCDSSRVISTGGNDRCAFVWRVVDVQDDDFSSEDSDEDVE